MKNCRVFGIFAVAAILFLGCVTPPEPEIIVTEPEIVVMEREVIREVASPPDTLMPLTPSILRRLHETNEIAEHINKFQLRLFGRIILEREFVLSNDGLDGGIVRFENLHIRENITINDQTEGVAMRIETSPSEIRLFVSFEADDNNQLVFVASNVDPNAFFHLYFTPSAASVGDERGALQYGREKFTVRFAGDTPPYLLILLSQRDTDTLNARTVTGRRVN